MFLQKYVQELDEQLARLIAARDKIASLAGTTPQSKSETIAPSVAVDDEPEPVPVVLKADVADDPGAAESFAIPATPAKRRGRPKGSRNKTTMIRTRRMTAPEPRALTSTVPTGPVVVSPAQLAKLREAVVSAPKAAATVAKPEQLGGGLDDLIRELTDRRATAFSPAA